MTSRSEVYEAIDTERDYQNKWGDRTHNVTEYLMYIEHYVDLCRAQVSTLDMSTPENNTAALENIRKITALGVVCMEQNGAPKRE